MDDPSSFLAYERDRIEEAEIKRRFRNAEDPLRIVIVTAKWLTGFDAPNLGAMYLDKPLTRTNRPRTNRATLHRPGHRDREGRQDRARLRGGALLNAGRSPARLDLGKALEITLLTWNQCRMPPRARP